MASVLKDDSDRKSDASLMNHCDRVLEQGYLKRLHSSARARFCPVAILEPLASREPKGGDKVGSPGRT